MKSNDIDICLFKHQVTIGDLPTIKYLPDNSTPATHHVRRAQAFVLITIVIWPGWYLEFQIPETLHSELSLSRVL